MRKLRARWRCAGVGGILHLLRDDDTCAWLSRPVQCESLPASCGGGLSDSPASLSWFVPALLIRWSRFWLLQTHICVPFPACRPRRVLPPLIAVRTAPHKANTSPSAGPGTPHRHIPRHNDNSPKSYSCSASLGLGPSARVRGALQVQEWDASIARLRAAPDTLNRRAGVRRDALMVLNLDIKPCPPPRRVVHHIYAGGGECGRVVGGWSACSGLAKCSGGALGGGWARQQPDVERASVMAEAHNVAAGSRPI